MLAKSCLLLSPLRFSFYSIQRDELTLKPCVVPRGWVSRHCDACSFMRADKHGPDGLSGACGRSPESSALKQCWCWGERDCDWQWETPVLGWAAGQYAEEGEQGFTTVRRGREGKREALSPFERPLHPCHLLLSSRRKLVTVMSRLLPP